MASYLDLFSPTTYEAFGQSDRTVSGFQLRHQTVAGRVKPGDTFLCYMTKLSRWFGELEVVDGPFVDEKPIFYPADDPFVVRFHVRTLIWLPVEKAIPIKEDELWNFLSFTKGYEKGSSAWAQAVKGSLRLLPDDTVEVIRARISRQTGPAAKTYPYDVEAYQSLLARPVPTSTQPVSVTVPTDAAADNEPAPDATTHTSEVRESIQIQALLAEIGSRMGFKIWIPRADRARVLTELKHGSGDVLEKLPLNYEENTLRTIEQIDVIWLKGRSIQRAFEVEHTTSIYSGLLRMADLLALQPNLNIRLHIVAPSSRRDKVFREITRPVFSLSVENQPLSKCCTLLTYDDVRDLSNAPNLAYLSDRVIEEYEESAVD